MRAIIRAITGALILTLGTIGSIVAYWWMGLALFFVGAALGGLTERVLTQGLLVVGALAGGGSGLLAASTALLGIRTLAVRPPRAVPVFLGTWVAWTLLGALGSAFLRHALSPLAAASFLGACHLVVCVLYLSTERWLIPQPRGARTRV